MKLLIDDANVAKIREISEFYPVDGVTTNPSILAKSGRPPFEVLREIREVIGDKELHVQVISSDCAGMIAEAEKIVSVLGKDTYIKVPVTREGVKAIKALSADGYKITATAIYTPMQAYLAAKAGADYAAPYVNRIDNLGANGIESAMTIHDIFVNNGFKTEVLAASFKNSQQVQALAAYGCGCATAAPDIIEGLITNPTVTAAVEAFKKDFESLVDEGTTMLDYE